MLSAHNKTQLIKEVLYIADDADLKQQSIINVILAVQYVDDAATCSMQQK